MEPYSRDAGRKRKIHWVKVQKAGTMAETGESESDFVESLGLSCTKHSTHFFTIFFIKQQSNCSDGSARGVEPPMVSLKEGGAADARFSGHVIYMGGAKLL